MRENHIVKCGLILIFILILSTSTASAFNRYDEKIDKGDGYQINNYFIEVFSIKSHDDNRLLTIKMYKLKSDGTYEELIGKLEDFQLGLLVNERQHEKISAIEISLDEL